MVFTSVSFLFFFLPVFLATHFLTPARWRNLHILVLSLIFYVVGGGVYTWLFLFSIVANHFGGVKIAASTGSTRKTWLILTLAVDLGLLGWFKYAIFFTHSLNSVLGGLALGAIPVPSIILPIGISFYTFQGMAYAIDVYNSHHQPARSLADFAVFKSCFPQIIAGPIVRFSDVSEAIVSRAVTLEGFHSGSLRFAWGLFRKMVIADSLAKIADVAFSTPLVERGAALAWVGIICYTLQIYHDFAGYSDMAIGMGRMMGFTFPENFAEPYRASSITMFWRRWHITLSSWFRDYLYIPLGGNRTGPWMTYRNLFVVFLLCGLWHGAAYTFVVWGIYHGTLLIIERVANDHFGFRPSGAWWLPTIVLVMVGWVFFRAEDLPKAFDYLQSLVGRGGSTPPLLPLHYYLTADRVSILCLAALLVATPLEWAQAQLARCNRSLVLSLQSSGALLLLVYASIVLASNGYNPFIYFRF